MRQRPIRHLSSEVRERQVLNAARDLFLEGGWDLFSIERIAEYLECSRPLVYTLFSCKEEILLALAIETKKKRLGMSEQVLKFRARPRERMVAIDMIEMFLIERHLPIELFVTSARLRAKTSNERQKELQALEFYTQSVGAGIVEEAIACGDLPKPRYHSADELYFSLWASIWGAAVIKRSDFPYLQSGITDPSATARRALLVMLDGFNWRPLTHEWDYRGTVAQIKKQVFDTETFQRLLCQDGASS